MESMTRTGDRPGLVGRVSAVSPRLAAIRDELREARVARAGRKALERDLASYTTASDLNDLGAILDRHSDVETADIRRILAARRTA
ncbi:MAG: hypothetical protein ACLPKI_26705 [Streptosporangiaceae bacterium]